MVNLTYRIASDLPSPPKTTVKNAPLTNQEIDANFKALADELELKATKNNPVFTGTVKFDTKGAVVMPFGTTAERPKTPEYGMFRINSTYGNFEYYKDGEWSSIAAGATGNKNDQIFYLNDQVINNDYTVPPSKNAMTAGKVTLMDTVTITVPEGARWIIV